MNIFRVFAKKSRKGFTLMETMVTVGIVAILCAIAIPAIVSVNRSLSFRDLDNSARSVYLAAQSNLAQMRSSGDLAELAKMTELDGAKAVPQRDNAGLAEGDWSEDLRYTVSGTKAFDLLLPANTVDSQLRSNSMLIEYNPVTGHVYSVFYREGDKTLSYGDLSRDEETRKTLELGYYCGGSVTIAAAEKNSTEVTLTAEDGQELILTLKVPVPESYTEHQDVFYENISAKILIRGESSGAEFVIPTDALTLEKELCIGSPNYIAFTYVMDSLNEAYGLTALNGELDKQGVEETAFIPGEDLSFEATVLFDAPEGYTLLRYDNVLLTGVNSLFSRVTKTGEGDTATYTIEIANGRHLQNLNRLDGTIAEKVTAITLAEDIVWRETADYYADAYTRSRTANAADYAHFTPIDTEYYTHASMTFDGQKHKILYLDIDVSKSDKAAGLLETCKFSVKNLALVSPTVKGSAAAGALAGTAETRASFDNCSVYIDTEAEGFSRDMLASCGVSGQTAGGLVGRVSGAENGAIAFTDCFAAVDVTGTETAGGLVGAAANGSFTRCYASGNVTGKTAGGFVGTSEKSTYTQCFASGSVYASGTSGTAGGFVGKLESYFTQKGNVKVTFSKCYAVGVVDGKQDGENNAKTDGFCGAGLTELSDGKTYENEVYKDTCFWNHKADDTSLCAKAVGYAALMYNSIGRDCVLTGWKEATATHAYSLNVQGSYPFVVYGDIKYYGDWPELTGPVVLAYYEKYQDDSDSETEEIGYYINSEKSSTLQNDRVILEDGYVLLAQGDSVSIDGKKLENWKDSKGSAIQFNGYNVYTLPELTETDNDFYQLVTVTVTTTGSQSQKNEQTYTFYYNPDFALTQINPVYNADGSVSTTAAKPSGVPGKIYIRTARHLAALMATEKYQGKDYHYVQMVDVDFTTYGTENNRSQAQTIKDFAGTYTGSGGYVAQAKITIGTGTSLFGTVSGTVKDIQVRYGAGVLAGNLLANTVSGTMENCDVTVIATDTQAVQAEESGVEPAAQNESENAQKTPIGGAIGTVSETGTVTDCDVIAATLTGAEAGFVGVNRGTISRCTVAPAGDKKTSGKTDDVTFGFAAENAGIIKNSMANTAADTAAFAGQNTGEIRDCYAWYAGTSETSDTETKIVFAETDEGEIITSYAAIDGGIGKSAYALVYDRAGVASFRDTWDNTTIPLGGNWYYYREAGDSYPYCVPDGITHRGGWAKFDTPIAHTGYYYYEKYGDENEIGLCIVILDDPKTEEDEGKTVSTLDNKKAITETGYGIFTMTSGEAKAAWESVALTLDSAPIVPAEVADSEGTLAKAFKTALKIENVTFEFKKLSADSVYVLNGTEINTWFAPKTAAGAYGIRTGEQFAAVEEFAGADFEQTRDITVTAPLSGFAGEYDGGEHCIAYAGDGMSHGLFGKLTGTVKYVTLKNATLNITLNGANGTETTDENSKTIIQDSVTAGVLADTAGEDARILHCRVVEPVITVTERAEEGKNLAIAATLGGLVGENRGSIKVCSVENLTVYYTAAVIADEHKDDTTYTADYTLGGLVGRMTEGWMSESFATGVMGKTDSTNEKYVSFAKADGETVLLGGAIGGEDAEKRATYVDCYAAVDIYADETAVGSFAGEVHGGTFWACAGWSGDNAWAGVTQKVAADLSLTKCYYYNSVGSGVEVKEATVSEPDGTRTITETKVEDCENVSGLVALLNGDDETVWSGETTYVDDEGNEVATYDTIYPVLKGRYDGMARVDEAMLVFIQPETAAAEEPAAEEENAPSEDMTAPETTAAPEETPDVTAEPEETATPEPTAEPEETTTPETTPEITAEPEPVPEETAGEETPEPAAEAPAEEE